MAGMLGFSYLIELGERADVARASLALSEEREEIARDVHDVLGYSLTVITLKAELAQRLLEIDPARAGAKWRRSRSCPAHPWRRFVQP